MCPMTRTAKFARNSLLLEGTTVWNNVFRDSRPRSNWTFRPSLEELSDRCVPSALNGSAGDMPTFYDGSLHTINFKEQPVKAEQSLLANNKSINIIYMSDTPLPGGAMFTPVINALRGPGQGPGFNPLWQEVQIVFNSGVTPFQLTSDNDILAAAAAGQITLVPTNEVYRCAVVGP
jgi:hypothetical protein